MRRAKPHEVAARRAACVAEALDNSYQAMQTKVGFIGLGAMGWPMATNLVKKQFDVRVFDVRGEVLRKFITEVGGTAATSARDAAKGVDVLITMLPNSKLVHDVLLGEGDAAAGLDPGAVVVDMSSGVPTETQATAAALLKRGFEMVDAPVSGAVRRAITGELSIVVGGTPQSIDRVRPVLLGMGKSITRAGDVGAAHATKALNNLALAGSFLIAVEALLIGKKFGLDTGALVDFINASSGMNYNTQTKFKQFLLSGTFAAGFATDLLVKDVGIALELAQSMDADVPFSTMCQALWHEASQRLAPASDHTEIAKVAAQKVGVAFP